MSLERALKYLLTKSETGFDQSSRVTIYRRQEGSDDQLRRIFRHSLDRRYNKNGRISVPTNEGVVGAAWNNHGEKEVEIDDDPAFARFTQEMNRQLSEEQCAAPTCELSMPSRHFVASAVKDLETGDRVGIVVYEHTRTGVLTSEGIRNVLSGEEMDVSRFIKHLGVLKGDFNPAPREE